jgi:endo-1,4-beta-mannosidase
MLDRLIAVADLAAGTGMALIPTLFTGHMSGVNWLPAWALGGSDRDERFRVVSNGRVTGSGLRNWYSDPLIARAHALLATEAAGARAGHGAVWRWDLGNENSNCVIPPTRSSGREWLRRIASAIRTGDPDAQLTLGLHMEDLENDRMLGPREASEVCDVLSMHGYPIYSRWAHGPTDEQLLPFLADVTRWLAGGRDLLFAEFGLPTFRRGDPARDAIRPRNASALVEEHAAAAYTERALAALQRAGCVGAMFWCYSDYDSAIWQEPPLDLAVHERSFGLWRADGSAKPSVAVVEAFAGARRLARPDGYPWIDLEPEEFLIGPDVQLQRLYGLYRTSEHGERAGPRFSV